MKRMLQVLIAIILLTVFVWAQKAYVNVDRAGLALQGYDPVAYFTQNKPVKGNANFQSSYKGATYYFASVEHKQMFDKEPAKYEPQFGGFCAYAVSRGYTARIEPDAFQIVNGRLLLQYDRGVRDKFNQDTLGNLQKADQNWPGLVQKKGK